MEEGSRLALEGPSVGSKTDLGGSKALVGPLGGVPGGLGRAVGGVQDRFWWVKGARGASSRGHGGPWKGRRWGPRPILGPDGAPRASGPKVVSPFGHIWAPERAPGTPQDGPPGPSKSDHPNRDSALFHFPRGVDRRVEDEIYQSRIRGLMTIFGKSTLGARGPLRRG